MVQLRLTGPFLNLTLSEVSLNKTNLHDFADMILADKQAAFWN